MSTDAVFKELEPPPGGAERFAQRLDEIAAAQPSRRVRFLGIAAAAAAVALVTAVLVLRAPNETAPSIVVNTPPPSSVVATPSAVEIYNSPEFDRLLGRSSQPAELTVVLNEEAAAVTQIATTNEKVRIYQIN